MTIELLTLRPHQEQALEEMANGKILMGGVGTGKTRVAVAYYLKNEAPKDVYVFTTAKKRDDMDWQHDFAMVGMSASESKYGKVVVDSYNNLPKYADISDAFIIMDEQRLVGTGVWVKTFLKLAKRNRWILLSATPGDTYLDYAPVFIANGFFKNITEFKREHCVYTHYGSFPKLDRFLGTNKLDRLRKSLLVDMPYQRHTTRHIHDVSVDHDSELMRVTIKRRWNPFTNSPMKDASELYSVMRRISNSSPDRMSKVLELLGKHKRLIVFYNFNYELEALRTLSSLGYSVAEWNGHKHEKIPQTDSWVYLVQYQSGAEGWNCVATDAMCFYSLTYSYRNWEQSFGRIDRLNTPYSDLHYYVLRSRSFIDVMIWRALKGKKNFNEKAMMMREVSLAA